MLMEVYEGYKGIITKAKQYLRGELSFSDLYECAQLVECENVLNKESRKIDNLSSELAIETIVAETLIADNVITEKKFTEIIYKLLEGEPNINVTTYYYPDTVRG